MGIGWVGAGWIALAGLVGVLAPTAAGASCGLEYCPVREDIDEAPAAAGQARPSNRVSIAISRIAHLSMVQFAALAAPARSPIEGRRP